ncbi:hypothetical protein CKM354_000071700 [Cercospora kikuchii]|uniref:Uncharacterized protein n=1 Tax=Cercospora kikuchii TaxID=84275 RepID=A0A9P3C6D9_9PEZI|nr:uncharacterized protein CKM354_000071700 [Cercospora kikuchii]GIZ37264.1 hypothetical protein CKM354_000071700 [Cercospora kikuchii]
MHKVPRRHIGGKKHETTKRTLEVRIVPRARLSRARTVHLQHLLLSWNQLPRLYRHGAMECLMCWHEGIDVCPSC